MALTASGAYDGLVNSGTTKGMHGMSLRVLSSVRTIQISDIDGKEFDFKQPYNGMMQ
jgi:hypothetical protein